MLTKNIVLYLTYKYELTKAYNKLHYFLRKLHFFQTIRSVYNVLAGPEWFCWPVHI